MIVVLTTLTGPHPRPFPSSPFHRLRCWRIASSFPARQAQPQHNTHLQQLRWRYADCSDDFHRRCQPADLYGSLDEIGGQRHELEEKKLAGKHWERRRRGLDDSIRMVVMTGCFSDGRSIERYCAEALAGFGKSMAVLCLTLNLELLVISELPILQSSNSE